MPFVAAATMPLPDISSSNSIIFSSTNIFYNSCNSAFTSSNLFFKEPSLAATIAPSSKGATFFLLPQQHHNQ